MAYDNFKSHKKAGFHPLLEDTISQKTQAGEGVKLTPHHPPPVLGLTCVYPNTIETCLTPNHLLFGKQLLYSSSTTSTVATNLTILSTLLIKLTASVIIFGIDGNTNVQ